MAAYVSLLEAALKDRKDRRASYSLRAFARDLDLSPAFLSQVLRRQRNLSTDTGFSVAKNLGLAEDHRALFVASVREQNARDEQHRTRLKGEVESLTRRAQAFLQVPFNAFVSISRWYHSAILEMTHIAGFRSTPQWIARRLGISVAQAKIAIDNLRATGLLVDKDGQLTKPTTHSRVADTPAPLIREYHLQMLERARRAIEGAPEPTRKIGGVTMAVDPTRVEEAGRRITRFRAELMAYLEGGERTQVYHFSTQLFRLDRDCKETNDEG